MRVAGKKCADAQNRYVLHLQGLSHSQQSDRIHVVDPDPRRVTSANSAFFRVSVAILFPLRIRASVEEANTSVKARIRRFASPGGLSARQRGRHREIAARDRSACPSATIGTRRFHSHAMLPPSGPRAFQPCGNSAMEEERGQG